MKRLLVLLLVLSAILIESCENEYYPKPRGYFRIDLPGKHFITLDTALPYSFEYPTYAGIRFKTGPGTEPFWIDVEFPAFSARLHISYKTVNGNLPVYIEDTRALLMKLIPKVDAIENTPVSDTNRRVFGQIFDIAGSNAASPCQFYLTDSTSHFIRGALYFSVHPNNDSLEPVITFLKEDIRRMAETLKWKF